MRFVYIIGSLNSKYKYIGCTGNLKRRLVEHNNGICKASKPYKPFRLLAYIAVRGRNKAIKLENYLKTGSGSAFVKKRLI